MSKFYGSFFNTNICGFISRDKFLYETRVLGNSYLRVKVLLPVSDSTKITAGGPKITLEGTQLNRFRGYGATVTPISLFPIHRDHDPYNS